MLHTADICDRIEAFRDMTILWRVSIYLGAEGVTQVAWPAYLSGKRTGHTIHAIRSYSLEG